MRELVFIDISLRRLLYAHCYYCQVLTRDTASSYGIAIATRYKVLLVRELRFTEAAGDQDQLYMDRAEQVCDVTPSHLTWLVHACYDSLMNKFILRLDSICAAQWAHIESMIFDVSRSHASWCIHMWHDSLINKLISTLHDPNGVLKCCNHMSRDTFLCDMTHPWMSCSGDEF